MVHARPALFLSAALGLLNTVTATASSSSAVLDLLPTTFDQVILQSHTPALVEFFAPWCGHCKTLAPVYEELAARFAFASDKLRIGKVDADEHKALGKRFGVQGFPTLKWFDGKSEVPEDYKGGRDLESLTAWVTEKTGIRPRAKKAVPSAVEVLSDGTFKGVVGGESDVIVAFTAPWCGHCKTLAPIWEQVATDFAAEPAVLIAKVDAEAENSKATAQAYDVSSYPTIKFFPRGSTEPVAYEGARTEPALLAFLNEKAGTHRVVGGGLDATAGTIAALDAVIGKITGGSGSLASISEEVVSAAKGLNDKYAEYYVKVVGKIGGGKGYVEKELGRLEGLLKRGGLAPGKVDDFTSRTNILRKFLVKEDGAKEEL